MTDICPHNHLTRFQELCYNQLSLLNAIAKRDRVTSPQANEFIKQYDLPSASSVKTALTVLLDKDLVYHDATGYWVYDHFFDLWLKQLV